MNDTTFLFYQTGLNTATAHTVQLVNTAADNSHTLGVTYFSVYSPLGEASHGSNVAVIAGPIVAGVVAILLIIVLIVIRRRRSRARRRQVYREEPYLLDSFTHQTTPNTSKDAQEDVPSGLVSVQEPVAPTHGKRAIVEHRLAYCQSTDAEGSRQSGNVHAAGISSSQSGSSMPVEALGPDADIEEGRVMITSRIADRTSRKVEYQLGVHGSMEEAEAPPQYRP